MAELALGAIKKAILDSDARWEAQETSFAKMAKEERLLLLGYVPGPGDPSLEERESVAKSNLLSFEAMAVAEVGYPASYDLRNVAGQNFITSIKNQGGCGSCVAFGVAATVEGTFRRQRNNPGLALDYSEAQLFYCYARSQGRNCSNGWWPNNALDFFRDSGVADESCYPYTAGDQNCTNLCSDWMNRATKITAWHRITSTAQIKEWISTRGPLSACFTVYSDFFSYRGGIYKHVTGGVEGGHCVSCIGYNDVEKYWICKNSWGPGFGESGFFRIAYGDCGIDAFMDAVDGISETGWERNKKVIGLYTINQDRNAWAYITDLGWRRVSFENDNIFFDMLSQLTSAKAGSRRVDIRQENGVIKELYVL
jgi:C1A family cysteine protease